MGNVNGLDYNLTRYMVSTEQASGLNLPLQYFQTAPSNKDLRWEVAQTLMESTLVYSHPD